MRTPKPRRWRKVNAKPGQLVARWGKTGEYRNEPPDLVYAWGPGVDRRDSRLLHYWFGCDRLEFDARSPRGTRIAPSFIKELEARGYDLTTLKFSIQKKEPTA